MLGGYDEKEGASLYLIDYLASMIEVPFTTNGYGGLITLSILDRYFKRGIFPSNDILFIFSSLFHVSRLSCLL